MRALLLAAGEGSRLRPLTLDRPKPMVEIGREPAIAHLLRWLRHHGVVEVAINLHHCPTILQDYVGDGAAFGLSVTYSLEPTVLGTAGALSPLRRFFDEQSEFAVLYGDVLTAVDLGEVVRAHRKAAADATIVVTQVADPTTAGIVAFTPGRRITRIVEKPVASQVFSPWGNAGVYVCGPRVLTYVSQPPQDFAHDLFPAMLRGGCHLMAFPTDARVIDFGSLDHLEAARAAIAEGAFALSRVEEVC